MHKLFKASFICAALAFSGATYAGLALVNPVAIATDSTGTTTARGSLRDARNSADSVAYIGCWVFATASPIAQCLARDASGTFASCVTTNPAMMQAAGSINAASFVRFVVDHDGSSCDSVQVEQLSGNL
jgi:hypothetical protein